MPAGVVSVFNPAFYLFRQDGSSDGGSGLGGKQSSRNARMDKMQRGGDYDLAGLLKKLVNIGVDDLRRQLKNPLKDSQVRLGTHIAYTGRMVIIYCRAPGGT